MTVPQILLLALLLLSLGLLLYWLLVTTEGAFLGRRVVVWLYDVTAPYYDEIKEFDEKEEWYLVTRPALLALADAGDEPLVLDVACGTGRVADALLNAPSFKGYLVGLDGSERMLALARKKLSAHKDRFELHHHEAVPLPFEDNRFDLVTCLETLEFLPDAGAALREMVRVLRPGGSLMTTRRRGWEARAFLNRYYSREGLEQFLVSLGLEQVHTQRWQVAYDLVQGVKAPSHEK